MTDSETVRRVILGTAGHIDHGKTALVERLTGTRTDRLKEEQERGMTIDVGYAEFELEDGTEVGLVDVPGHERLVRTMVAAATAVDLVLLVVAADDGPMPQTREHVEILDLLGVERLVVAITKTDLSDPETIELVEEETREMLAETGMAGAPMVQVSSQTGEGIEALRRTILDAIPPARPDDADLRAFRMPVLRAFMAKGRGAVLTGIPLSGRIEPGEPVEILPTGSPARVRSIQVHKRPAEEARAHRRTALALSDVEAPKIHRGMVVGTAKVFQAQRRLVVRVRLLPHSKPLAHRDRVRLHVGAAQVVARVHLLEADKLDPGARSIAELEAFEDILTAPGDRFVLRAENASSTLGGGVVIEPRERRLPRRRQGIVQELLERSERLEDPQVLVRAALRTAGEAGTRQAEIAAATGLRPRELPAIVDRLAEAGEARRLGHTGDLWIDQAAFDKVLERVETGAKQLHKKDAALEHLPISAVRTAAGRVETAVLDAALDHRVDRRKFVRTGQGGMRHSSHTSSLTKADRADLEAVKVALASGRGQPPAIEDLEGDLRLTQPRVLRALRLLKNRGEVLQAGEYYFDGPWVEEAKEKLRGVAREKGGFTPADARSLLDTTRKWVIPLLEALDRSGFSRRAGDKRVVRE